MSLRDELIQVAAVAVAIVTDLDQGSTIITSGEHNTRYDDAVLMGIIYDILDEREKQEAKWGTRFNLPVLDWLMILVEEAGEACDEIDLCSYCSDDSRTKLAKQILVDVSIAGDQSRRWLETDTRGEQR